MNLIIKLVCSSPILLSCLKGGSLCQKKIKLKKMCSKELIQDLIDKAASLEECELIENKYKQYFMGDEILDIIYEAKKAKGFIR